MDDYITDAITQFLRGRSWLQPIEDFTKSYSLYFLNEEYGDYTLDQHAIFQKFQKLVDELLTGVLNDLGCDSDSFIKNLEEKLYQPVEGPRDESINELIECLLSWDNFEQFYTLMIRYNKEGGLDQIYSQEQVEQTLWNTEWYVQEQIAESIVEAEKNGYLSEEERDFVPWAKAIIEMRDLAQAASNNDNINVANLRAEDQIESPRTIKLKELEQTLAVERLKVDLLVAQRMAEGNHDLRKRVFKDPQRVHEVADENIQEFESPEEELARLIERIECIRSELATAKSSTLAFTNVKDSAVEEIYLFLKEKIHYNHDLAIYQDEISNFIFSRIQSSDAGIVTPMLLWLTLEAELGDTQKRINDILNGTVVEEPPDPDYSWVEYWDDAHACAYYFNSATGESSWYHPLPGYWNAEGEWQQVNVTPPVHVYANDDAGNSEINAQAISEKKEEIHGQYAIEAEQKYAAIQDLGSTLDKILELGDKPTLATQDIEQEVLRLSKEHEEEAQKLKMTLQIEQARQKAEIQKRKEKRRRDKQRKKDKQASEAAAPKPPTGPPAEIRGKLSDDESKEKEMRRSVFAPAPPVVRFDANSGSGIPDPVPLDSILEIDPEARDVESLLKNADLLRTSLKDNAPAKVVPLPLDFANAPRLSDPRKSVLNPSSLRFLSKGIHKNSWVGFAEPPPPPPL